MIWKVCLILATTRWYHPLGRWAFFRLTIGIPCWKPSLCDNPRYVLDGTWTICSVKNKNILNHSGYLADFGIEHQLLEVASALFKALSKGYIFLSLPQFRHGLEHIRTLFSKMFPLKTSITGRENLPQNAGAFQFSLLLDPRRRWRPDQGPPGLGMVIPMVNLPLLGMVNIPHTTPKNADLGFGLLGFPH